jgi:hypothetical protein
MAKSLPTESVTVSAASARVVSAVSKTNLALIALRNFQTSRHQCFVHYVRVRPARRDWNSGTVCGQNLALISPGGACTCSNS